MQYFGSINNMNLKHAAPSLCWAFGVASFRSLQDRSVLFLI
jgi:hypothetical protein